jgi:hypothetical protein
MVFSTASFGVSGPWAPRAPCPTTIRIQVSGGGTSAVSTTRRSPDGGNRFVSQSRAARTATGAALEAAAEAAATLAANFTAARGSAARAWDSPVAGRMGASQECGWLRKVRCGSRAGAVTGWLKRRSRTTGLS